VIFISASTQADVPEHPLECGLVIIKYATEYLSINYSVGVLCIICRLVVCVMNILITGAHKLK
jgi:hypothetical protein